MGGTSQTKVDAAKVSELPHVHSHRHLAGRLVRVSLAQASASSTWGMVCGLDLHGGQIDFDAVQLETGAVWRARLWSSDRAAPVVGCARRCRGLAGSE
jgi:hypothetical protein